MCAAAFLVVLASAASAGVNGPLAGQPGNGTRYYAFDDAPESTLAHGRVVCPFAFAFHPRAFTLLRGRVTLVAAMLESIEHM